jgi:hypothetical protein
LTLTLYIEKLLENDDSLAIHLSENATLYQYKKTLEEDLIVILRTIQRLCEPHPRESWDGIISSQLAIERAKPERAKNVRLLKILRADYLVKVLTIDLLPLGSHFRLRREFKIKWLSDSLAVHMRVSA